MDSLFVVVWGGGQRRAPTKNQRRSRLGRRGFPRNPPQGRRTRRPTSRPRFLGGSAKFRSTTRAIREFRAQPLAIRPCSYENQANSAIFGRNSAFSGANWGDSANFVRKLSRLGRFRPEARETRPIWVETSASPAVVGRKLGPFVHFRASIRAIRP